MTRLTTIFGQVYLTSALLTFVATFLPLWSSPEVDMFDTMSLWQGAMIDNRGGSVAGAGLALAFLLVTTLLLATFTADRGPFAALGAAVMSIPGLVLLLTKPYSSTPEPSLGTGGALMLALAVIVIVTAFAHGCTWALADAIRDDESPEQQAAPLPMSPV